MSDSEKLVAVTEVGTFGNLNIDDPTVTEIKKKKRKDEVGVDSMIQEAITENANITV